MTGSHILSRRAFIAIAAAGSAATLPAVAFVEAGHSIAPPRQPQAVDVDDSLSLDAQLSVCVAQLRAILLKMNESCKIEVTRVTSEDTGDRTIIFTTRYPRGEWSGNGLYLLRQGHGEHPFWVDLIWSDMDGCWIYAAAWWNGENKVGPRQIYSAETLPIIRKLGEGAGI
ncbi:hypothetical protein PDO_4476 [Rhizobium sp. PDO1-076]|uniref:hypothetical protein n=1 Tax=Rhizobium sp. PDO1-076 TaxID=1125979 RepID=UPI00024E2CA7|nr:hypothetical protein [Rhizobium sp. PDO1-076]EHS53014.1 hypothetical protein PDO_4476 [Rhizobium sp. PDO1-076]